MNQAIPPHLLPHSPIGFPSPLKKRVFVECQELMDKFACRVFVMISEDGLSSQYMGSQDFVTEFLTTGLKVKPCDVNVGHCHSSDIDRSDVMCVPGMRDGQMEKSFSIESKNLRNHPAGDASRQDAIQNHEGRNDMQDDADNGTGSTSQSANDKWKIRNYFQPVQLSSKDSSAPLTHSSVSSTDFGKTENSDTLNSESVLSKNMLSQFASKATHWQNDVMTMTESSNQSAGSTHAPESTSNINVADVQAVDQITGRYEDVTGRDDFQETGETKTGHGVSKMESTQTGGIMDFEESRRGDNIPSSVPVQDNSREKTHCLDTSRSEEGGYHGNSDVADEINETGVQDDTTDDYQNEVDSLSESSVQSKRSGSRISGRPKRKKRHVNRPKNQGDCLSESSVESKTSGSQTSKQPKRKKRRSNRPEMTEQELETHKERIRKSMIDDKPHICEKCGKGYKTQQGLSVHLSVGICVRQKCKYCGLEFLYKDWQNHLVDVHAEQIRVSQCDHCDKLFTGRSTKSHHIETQHSKGRYECDICKSVFTYQRGLVLHKQSHSEKTLQCRHCHARFVKEAKRMEHERRVHNEVLSVCTECGETFNTKIKMIYHHQTVHLKPSLNAPCAAKSSRISTIGRLTLNTTASSLRSIPVKYAKRPSALGRSIAAIVGESARNVTFSVMFAAVG
ncbi:uncharacterized protein [Ptychodera flava]|uniref:uncharacterized protein n=1 Tax=Ptychodera flava TaxID=63121 RepID=UPI003969DA00